MAPQGPRRAVGRRRQAVDFRPNNDPIRIDQSGACAGLHHDRLVSRCFPERRFVALRSTPNGSLISILLPGGGPSEKKGVAHPNDFAGF